MFFIKKKIQKLLSFFVLTGSLALAAADDWILAAQKFSLPAAASSTGSQQIASLLPQLILEQISTGGSRLLPTDEVLARSLDSLQTQRLSLILQLSKEYKTRDALVANILSPKKLEKELLAEQKKIAELEKQIEENLSQADKEIQSKAKAIEREEAIQRGEGLSDQKNNGERRFPFQLPLPFFRGEEEEARVSESLALYKNDISALFAPSAAALSEGEESRSFEKEVLAAKINGLITGSILAFGDYLAVTINLRIYPGAKVAATITDVGLASDLLSLAERLTRSLTPRLTNALPLQVHILLLPEEARAKSMLTLDGIVFQPVPHELSVDAGIHTISVAAPGYEPASVTYAFEGRQEYRLSVSLLPEVKGILSLRLKKLADGMFYANGINSVAVTEEAPQGKLLINGKSVMGIFTTGSGESDKSSFIYIPAELAREDARLVVNAKPYDRASNIDKRRRRMYTAYSALICSLPVTYYCIGNFTAANNAYSMGRSEFEDAVTWQNRMYISLGLTAVCGAWTVFELFRYLRAANDVLPATASRDKTK